MPVRGTIEPTFLNQLVRLHIAILREIAATRIGRLPELRREADRTMQEGLFKLAKRWRQRNPDESGLEAYLGQVRAGTLLKVADIISARHPELKRLLHHIPPVHRA